jgi:hypothetical protein
MTLQAIIFAEVFAAFHDEASIFPKRLSPTLLTNVSTETLVSRLNCLAAIECGITRCEQENMSPADAGIARTHLPLPCEQVCKAGRLLLRKN